jgi:hypothetical protein
MRSTRTLLSNISCHACALDEFIGPSCSRLRAIRRGFIHIETSSMKNLGSPYLLGKAKPTDNEPVAAYYDSTPMINSKRGRAHEQLNSD